MTCEHCGAPTRWVDGWKLDQCIESKMDFFVKIRELRAQVAALEGDIAAEKLFSKQAMQAAQDMAAQRDEFEGDAGRYRWLREHSGEFQGPEIFVNGKYELGSDLDAAIDAAVNHPPQPAQPAPRTADCLMCGHCAAMSNTIPLPPIVECADEHYHGEGLADAVHAHAAAVSAAKDARIKVLEDALKSFTKSTYIRHQHPRRFAAAVAALGDKNG